jgi:hypothetical protein
MRISYRSVCWDEQKSEHRLHDDRLLKKSTILCTVLKCYGLGFCFCFSGKTT